MTQDKTSTNPISQSDQARADILEACLMLVPFDGWSQKTLSAAARDSGYSEGAADLYFPGGVLEVIRFWSKQCDVQAQQALAEQDLSALKIREKVTQGALLRLQAIGRHDIAAKRAMSRLLFPDAIGQGPAQLWASADMIWRAIGDTSTDMNYYSKRAILSGVLGSSLISWLGDNSADKADARAFLDARIANVMQFEKAKWDFKKRTEHMPNPAEILGRIRYGAKSMRRRRRY